MLQLFNEYNKMKKDSKPCTISDLMITSESSETSSNYKIEIHDLNPLRSQLPSLQLPRASNNIWYQLANKKPKYTSDDEDINGSS
jgi:hypothetical protein